MKGIPLAYNKDMQEDKELSFDAMDNVLISIKVFNGMLSTLKFNKERMLDSAAGGFTNATDAADYLVKKGMPFRDAHGVIGQMVVYCIKEGKSLNELSMEEFKEFSELFDEDIYEAIDLKVCVDKRLTIGAPGEKVMEDYVKNADEFIETEMGRKFP